MVLKGCAKAVNFIGKSTMLKRDCKTKFLKKFVFKKNKWISTVYKKKTTTGFAGDAAGNLWIYNDFNTYFWRPFKKSWEKSIAAPRPPAFLSAGMIDHVYVISMSGRIFRFNADTWIEVPEQRASTIAVGS